MFCPNCGKELTEITAFCPFCGEKISTEDRTVVLTRETNRTQMLNNQGANVATDRAPQGTEVIPVSGRVEMSPNVVTAHFTGIKYREHLLNPNTARFTQYTGGKSKGLGIGGYILIALIVAVIAGAGIGGWSIMNHPVDKIEVTDLW